jgi:hypothetical protein
MAGWRKMPEDRRDRPAMVRGGGADAAAWGRERARLRRENDRLRELIGKGGGGEEGPVTPTTPPATGWLLGTGTGTAPQLYSTPVSGGPFYQSSSDGPMLSGVYDGTNFTILGGGSARQTVQGSVGSWGSWVATGLSQQRYLRWRPGVFMAAGLSGQVSRSFDGASWSALGFAGGNTTPCGLTWHKGYWFYSNNQSIWRYHPDAPWQASSWVPVSSQSGVTILGIMSTGEDIVGYGASGGLLHVWRPLDKLTFGTWERVNLGLPVAGFGGDSRAFGGPDRVVVAGNVSNADLFSFRPDGTEVTKGRVAGEAEGTPVGPAAEGLFYDGYYYSVMWRNSKLHMIRSTNGAVWNVVSTLDNVPWGFGGYVLTLDVPSKPYWMP